MPLFRSWKTFVRNMAKKRAAWLSHRDMPQGCHSGINHHKSIRHTIVSPRDLGKYLFEIPVWKCFWIVVLEKTLESPLDCKEIKPVNPKGNQSRIFTGSSDAEADQYFGHLMRRTDSLEKTLMLGKTEGGRRRGRQDDMVGWHHWLDSYNSEQAPGVGDGQGSLACCSPWSLKESQLS